MPSKTLTLRMLFPLLTMPCLSFFFNLVSAYLAFKVQHKGYLLQEAFPFPVPQVISNGSVLCCFHRCSYISLPHHHVFLYDSSPRWTSAFPMVETAPLGSPLSLMG